MAKNYVGKRYFKVEPETVERFFKKGMEVIPTNCPRCGQLLQREPGLLYCRLGCTRTFPIKGASITQQREYEKESGLYARA